MSCAMCVYIWSDQCFHFPVYLFVNYGRLLFGVSWMLNRWLVENCWCRFPCIFFFSAVRFWCALHSHRRYWTAQFHLMFIRLFVFIYFFSFLFCCIRMIQFIGESTLFSAFMCAQAVVSDTSLLFISFSLFHSVISDCVV